ncbi:unnamed protein product [Durusdinium trenchii]|uniref:Uncharacterized protein n=1 Tax=Durusdinium trenchii TaxID=1381693 RepID=A0ABP0PF15_9DINO
MSTRTCPAALELMRRAVDERSKGERASFDLLQVREGHKGDFVPWIWHIPCEEELPRVQRAAGFEFSPVQDCGRAVWESFASPLEVAMLRAFAQKSFEGHSDIPHRGAEVSLVLPLHQTCHSTKRTGIPAEVMDFAWSLLRRVEGAILEALMPSTPLELRGALLRRVQLPALTGHQQMMPSHDSFAAHADRATVAAYHYSAVLYLDEAGKDFEDGELLFMDRHLYEKIIGKSFRFGSNHWYAGMLLRTAQYII